MIVIICLNCFNYSELISITYQVRFLNADLRGMVLPTLKTCVVRSAFYKLPHLTQGRFSLLGLTKQFPDDKNMSFLWLTKLQGIFLCPVEWAGNLCLSSTEQKHGFQRKKTMRNNYRLQKLNWRPEFKSRTNLFAFHFVLMHFLKCMNPPFYSIPMCK